MAGQHIVYKGDDWKFDFQYTEDGDAKDITGATEIRACLKGDTASVEVTLTDAEIVITNSAAGKGTIKIPDTKTALVKKGTQSLTVEITDSDADITTVVLEEFLEVKIKDC